MKSRCMEQCSEHAAEYFKAHAKRDVHKRGISERACEVFSQIRKNRLEGPGVFRVDRP